MDEPNGAAESSCSSKNSSVSDAIANVEKQILDMDDSIKKIEEQLKLVKADKSPDAKGTEQELLASLESAKTSKSALEVSRDQLVKSGGFEAATVEHILKTSKEAGINSDSVRRRSFSFLR